MLLMNDDHGHQDYDLEESGVNLSHTTCTGRERGAGGLKARSWPSTNGHGHQDTFSSKNVRNGLEEGALNPSRRDKGTLSHTLHGGEEGGISKVRQLQQRSLMAVKT